MSKPNLKKNKVSSSSILSCIKNSKTEAELSAILSDIDWETVRGKNGENLFHMIAKHLPQFLKTYASDNFKLMMTPDNNGRYPVEYFLCFSDKKIINENIGHITFAYPGMPDPDWLEVKMLIIENQATHSGIDSAMLDGYWKQKTELDFVKSMLSKRGKKLIHMIANDFQYKKNEEYSGDTPYDEIYCGMDINKYINPHEVEKYSFLKWAQTKDEIKFALMQAWRIYYHKNEDYRYATRYNINYKDENHSMFNFISESMDKALNLGIDIAKMKEQIISTFSNTKTRDDRRTKKQFNDFMSEKFEKWEHLEALVERKKLLAIVSNKQPQKGAELCSVL